MPEAARGTYLNLDDAWHLGDGFDALDLRAWGPRLRYHGKRSEVEELYHQIEGHLTSFVLYGSGDFHYLAALLLRRVDRPVILVSFDNHPDWDVRPPYWSCGGWINRALGLPNVQRVSIWGCGNFELRFPSRMFANHRALRSGRLAINAWAERQPPQVQRRFNCMMRHNWRDRFETFAASVGNQALYITVDLDCLRAEEAVTNWENGLFTADEVGWAIGQLRERARIIGADVCGAYSKPRYTRWFQSLAGTWDHPRAGIVDETEAQRVNAAALKQIWPALIGGE